MKSYLLSPDKLSDFVRVLSRDGSLYYPQLEDGKTHLVKYDEDKPLDPNFEKIRTAENVKHFFFPSRDTVARFPKDEVKAVPKSILFGIKNCDLRGIDVYDRVFMGWDPVDPFYRERRDKILIISADCPEPEDSCFCNLVSLNPYGDGISDLNFTEVSGGLPRAVLLLIRVRYSRVFRYNALTDQRIALRVKYPLSGIPAEL